MMRIPTKALRQGAALGGPLAGQVLTTDYPKGIIIVDKPKGMAWVYDWNYNTRNFQARAMSALVWDETAEVNIRRAAAENNYEVRSHPKAGEDY
jgi:hypothetical protein